MSPLKPQTRFLVRGSALLIAFLTLWWFALLTPMLWALEGVGGVVGGLLLGGRNGELIHQNATGDWTFHVPLEMTLTSPAGQPAQQVHSIDFDMPRSDVIAFTFSLPVFWAIALALPGWRRNWRPLVIGTVLTAALELMLLLAFAEISAHKAAAQLSGIEGAADTWILRFGEYLAVSVLPYAAPMIIALVVNPGLRWEVFRWGANPDFSGTAPLTTRKSLKKTRK